MSSFYPPFGNASAQQLCQRCGRPLPSHEVYCGNCGHYNPFLPAQTHHNAAAQSPASMSWGNAGAAPQASFGAQQFAGSQWGPLTDQPVANGSFPGAAGQQGSPGGFYAATAPQQQTTGSMQPGSMIGYQSNGFAQPFAAPAAPAGGPQGGYQAQEFTQPLARKSRPHVGRIILVAVLALAVIGAVIGGGFFYMTRHSASTPSSTPTTASIAPTAVPKGAPLFQDAFTNNKNGWDTTSQQGLFSVKVGNDALVLEDDNNRLLWELLPGGKNFKDFFLTVDATLSKGAQNNGYGIYIRGASNQNVDIATYYRFEVYGDGTFAIFIGKVDASGTSRSSPIMNYALGSAIHKQGQVNHIAISAKGQSMSFLVNGQVLKTFTDNTYSAGSIALFVSNLTPPSARATFSNLRVYPPQS